MPGLNQLKKFSEDIQNIGDEVKIRLQRKEKLVTVPLPENISFDDDSDEFVFGIPQKEENDAAEASSSGINLEDSEIVDLAAFDENEDSDFASSPAADSSSGYVSDMPSLDDLLNGSAGSDGDGFDDSDLAEFEMDLTPGSEKKENDGPALEDLSLDDLLNSSPDSEDAIPDFEDAISDSDSSVSDLEPAELEELPQLEELSSLEDLPAEEDAAAQEISDIEMPSDFGEMPNSENIPEMESISELENIPSEDAPLGDSSFDLDSIPTAEDLPQEDFSLGSEGGLDSINDAQSSGDGLSLDDLADNFSLDDLPQVGLEDSSSGNSDAGETFEVPDFDTSALDDIPAFDEGTSDSESAENIENIDNADSSSDAGETFEVPDFDTSALDDIPAFDEGTSDSESAESIENIENAESHFDAGELGGDLPDISGDLTALDDAGLDSGMEDSPSSTEMDFSTDGLDNFDIDNLNSSEDSSFDGDPVFGLDSVPENQGDVPDASLDVSDFDADSFLSEMGIPNEPDDFSGSSSDSSFTFDKNDIPQMDADDFQLANPGDFASEDGGTATGDFVIPGFSDTTTAKIEKKRPSASGAKANEKPKNTLTEDEYVVFKNNFKSYPLNLRIAFEEFVVNDEFTDDAVFEIVEKILKKAPARQVAAALEKMLATSIPVPRDYERRSVQEYEAYKQSFQYQLKNRIIPGAIAAIILGFVGYSLFLFSNYFIYRPLKASSLYKQGYALIETKEYPQSEILFNEAVATRPVKNWFYKYAQAYRQERQYERAAKIYKGTLNFFNHDKTAGLEWGNMELYDRANFPMAEEIARREVLDYYINDADGYLLLGDVYLEWAETDPSKFEDARSQYARLINLYGATDTYMGRMMRYFIRLDGPLSLKRVLELKGRFYSPKKSVSKKALSGNDWVELSGYLFDKLYGPLTPSEEPLRPHIEDLYDMLKYGTEFSPDNPVGHYNIARYYEKTENYPSAKAEFRYCLDLFDKAPVRNKKNTYREINADRHLGELYSKEHEFFIARETYTKGINLFQRENKINGLPGTKEIGQLYADMGDLDYFIGGDMDAALYNYTTSIKTENDNPYLRYKVGNIHYTKHDYSAALMSFIKAAETKSSDLNLLLALGNTLSIRGDNFASLGYYEDLMDKLNFERAKRDVIMPEQNPKDMVLLDMFIKATNNLGVTEYRLAKQTGDSDLNAKALVNFSTSIRAYDALTRDQKTMLKSDGSNLAAVNSKYVTHPYSDFEPSLYTEIPRTLIGEKGLN